MTEPAQDELHGGAERPPLRLPRSVRLVALVAVIALVAYLATRPHDDPEPAAVPHLSATPPAPADVDVDPPPLSQPGPFGLEAVCVETDHARRLTVLFDIRNGSLSRTTVLQVTPVLPIGGLRPASVRVGVREPCDPELAGGRDLLMRPRATVSVRLEFRLPRDCPAPYPVEAEISFVGAGEVPRTQRLHLLNDLGALDFETCQT